MYPTPVPGKQPRSIVVSGLSPGRRFSQVVSARLACLAFLAALLAGCATAPNVKAILARSQAELASHPLHVTGPDGLVDPATGQKLLDRMENLADAGDFLTNQIGLMQRVTDRPLVAGNAVTLLLDGNMTYDAMFAAIRNATDHVNFETYIFEDDEVGRSFADILIAKSREGVVVNLIYDSVGSFETPAAFFQRMRDNGIRVVEFNPIDPTDVPRGNDWRLRHRDHRKILVVDGKVAFTGGVNISSVYSSSSLRSGSRAEKPWRDTQLRVEGPAAAEFQKLFLDTWARQKGPALPEASYFPEPVRAGPNLVMAVGSRSGEDNRDTYLMYMFAFLCARSSILVEDPYFVPDDQLLEALIDAAKRGVDVRLILSGHSDAILVYYAGHSYYHRLLSAGVKLYESRDRMLHAKTAVVDDVWSTVGSTNLDIQSLLVNDEVNAIVLGLPFAEEMKAAFAADLGNSDLIRLEEWENRSAGDRIKEWFSRFLFNWL